MRPFPKATISFSILAITLALSSITFTQVNAAIPDLEANKNERSLSNPSYILGQYWFRKLNGSPALIDFPPAYDYLKDALSRILPQTDLYNKKVEMTLLNSTKSNAFVIPGNHLFIYSDIMAMINNEDMLFGLLSHEVAHLDLRHFDRQNKKSGEEFGKALVLISAGIAAALAGASSDATTALWLGGIANQAENTLAYSRKQEQEADRRGQQYLVDAGLNPNSMRELFKAFFKKALGRPNLEFLATHPSPNARLSDSFRAQPQATILSNKTQSDFDYFRASMLAYRAGLESHPYAYLDQTINNLDASNFAKALLSYLTHSPTNSIKFLNKIKQDNGFTYYLRALSYTAEGNTQKGLESVEQQLDLDPNNILFSTLYAELTKTKTIKVNADYLYEKRLVWRSNIQYFQSRRNTAMALNYRALLDFSQGKDKTAQYLINRAKQNAQGNEKNIIKETSHYFKKIKEAEKQQDLN